MVFNEKVIQKFLEKNDFDLICRAHQVVEEGYEFFGDRQLVTVFSAPDYCDEFDNAGAMMVVDENLMCSFKNVCVFYFCVKLRKSCHCGSIMSIKITNFVVNITF